MKQIQDFFKGGQVREIRDHIVEGDLPQNQLKVEVMDEPGAGGANHRYDISGMESHNPSSPRSGAERQMIILFQNGPIKEAGLNGVTQEVLLAIIIDRLRCFQEGPFPSDLNLTAFRHCCVALDCLKARTIERLSRGIEGETKA
jgi:hypothetical protein